MKSKLPYVLLLVLIAFATGGLFYDVYFTESTNTMNDYILWQLRVPTVLTAILAGGILSLTGLNYQYLFQNHLASPYTLGMASASAFGAAFFTLLNHYLGNVPLFLQPLFGITFSLLTIFILLRFLGENQRNSLFRVLLAGIACSLIFSSLIILVQYLAGNRDGFELMVSLMGNVSMIGYTVPIILLVLMLITIIFTVKNFSGLRLLSVNYDFFQSQAGESKAIFYQSIIIPSVATAYLVTELGPISFVGLIVPHVIRLFIRPSGKEEVFLNVFLGGAFLLFCTMLAKYLIPNTQLPVGVMTSIMGGIFLITVLFR